MKRITSLLLCVVMMLSLMAVGAVPEAAPAADAAKPAVSETVPAPAQTSADPSTEPTTTPSAEPTTTPSAEPTTTPSTEPTTTPSAEPTEETEVPNPTPETAEPTMQERYEQLMACETWEAAEAYVGSLTAEQQEALAQYIQADAQRLADYEAKLQQLAPSIEVVPPVTVPVIQAGPMLPAVDVSEQMAATPMLLPMDWDDADAAGAAKVEDPKDTADGIYADKRVTDNGNGTYTITMEAYTTGEVKTETKTTPVDIVLVLDQSGSMNFSFSGSDNGTKERQKAMKSAVSGFIDSVSKKYSAEADHRIALVEFRSDAEVIKGWTTANAAGAASLNKVVKDLRAEGATNVGAGMQQAETLMGPGYNYTGNNKERQKVVIVFTDGVPTTGTEFHTGVANTAISSAKNLKADGVTVYSIGIFNGANPAKTYGDEKNLYHKSNGTVGSKWGAKESLFSGDVALNDIGAGNRFLNYISSNYKDSTEIGIESYHDVISYIPYRFVDGWKIIRNFTRTAPADKNYYLSAKNSAELNTIFQTISQQIGTPTIDLGTKTVVKDVMSKYFKAPANADAVKIYTADYNGSAFEQQVESNLQATVDGDTVTVTGFDFNANFVTNTAKADGSFGKKLIIEFVTEPKDGFLGGSAVPTNDSSSGIYEKPNANKPLEKFPKPTVDVPVGPVAVTAPDYNVYLLGGVTAEQMKSGATYEVTAYQDGKLSETKTEINPNEPNYGLEPWQTAFVALTDSVDPATGHSNLTDDAEYTVTLHVGGQPYTATGKISVFKPVVTFQDSTINMGQTANYDGSDTASTVTKNFVQTEWKHDAQDAKDVEVTGTAPELTFTYNPAAAAFTEETPVTVTSVQINGTEVKEHTAFYRMKEAKCDSKCDLHNATAPQPVENDINFKVHIGTFDLTISKTVKNAPASAADDTFVFTVKRDGQVITQVTLKAGERVTIKNLPSGEYTVEEDLNWSWRYTCDNRIQNANAVNNSLTFTNNFEKNQWLNFSFDKLNQFQPVTPAVN